MGRDAGDSRACSGADVRAAQPRLRAAWSGNETEKLPRLDFGPCLQMATINGARALGLEQSIGSLSPGKHADIVLVRATDLNMAPLGEVRTALVRSATPANVDNVIVDGRFLKRGGRLLDIDVAQVVPEANESLAAIRRRAGGAWTPAGVAG